VSAGRLIGVGVGPGDPELLTLKALRCLERAPVIAYVSAQGRPSIARQIAAQHVPAGRKEMNLALPMNPLPELADAAYDEGASRIGTELEQGYDVVVLCEGDPFFYGSFAQLFSRLGQHYVTEIVPGVSSINAASAAIRQPLVSRSASLVVVPATLPAESLMAKLRVADAAAVLKLGRHVGKVRRVLVELGLLERAIYVEWAGTEHERWMQLADLETENAPYFALVLLPAEPHR